jgi:hypothetical protein
MLSILNDLKKVKEFLAQSKKLNVQLKMVQAQLQNQKQILEQALLVVNQVDQTLTLVTQILDTLG